MKIKPFPGRVLVELLPHSSTQSPILSPSRPLSAEEVQERDHDPQKPLGLRGRVCAVGSPGEVAVGDIVFIPHNAGTLMRRAPKLFRMVKQEQVLAVVT